MAGIMSQMMISVLQIPDDSNILSECEGGSIGGYVRNWFEMAFPGIGIKTIKNILATRPAEFYARISATAEIEGFAY